MKRLLVKPKYSKKRKKSVMGLILTTPIFKVKFGFEKFPNQPFREA